MKALAEEQRCQDREKKEQADLLPQDCEDHPEKYKERHRAILSDVHAIRVKTSNKNAVAIPRQEQEEERWRIQAEADHPNHPYIDRKLEKLQRAVDFVEQRRITQERAEKIVAMKKAWNIEAHTEFNERKYRKIKRRQMAERTARCEGRSKGKLVLALGPVTLSIQQRVG